MSLPVPEMLPAKVDEEFSRPVESIMRCEDFKSNFARRLSNRFTARSPVTARDSKLKLRPAEENSDRAPERIEPCSQLSKTVVEQNGGPVKSPEKNTVKNSDIRYTEVSALNLEVETLRWQLAQTEANRQMHIALLKQIVNFLSRVKEHIACQKSESECVKKEAFSPKSFDSSHLPIRSRSVLHVNKNIENSLSPTKRVNTRKISKSISNVHGYNDSSGVWGQSKFLMASETENAQKITEEMSRLMTLANTVLSTKLPDLACTCTDLIDLNNVRFKTNSAKEVHDESKAAVNDVSNDFLLDTESNTADIIDSLMLNYLETNDSISTKSTNPRASSPDTCEIEKNFGSKAVLSYNDKAVKQQSLKTEPNTIIRKSNDKKCEAIFIEDESGFSSMTSFQEIGIPIISIIPPSPCKELAYLDDVPDLLEDAGQWKSGSIELDKQTMKVFWV